MFQHTFKQMQRPVDNDVNKHRPRVIAQRGQQQRGRMQDSIDSLSEGKDLGAVSHTAEMRCIRSRHNIKANDSMFTREALRQRRTESP